VTRPRIETTTRVQTPRLCGCYCSAALWEQEPPVWPGRAAADPSAVRCPMAIGTWAGRPVPCATTKLVAANVRGCSIVLALDAQIGKSA
jgi:hypothetical protein